MQLVVAVTGGIGAGKSSVSAHLRSLGAVVIDSDVVAREVVAPGTEGLAAVREAFGATVVGSDGALDRPALATIVFADPDARRRLEAITHPLVRARVADLVRQAPADAVVVNDIPLLRDLPAAAGYQLVVGVFVETEERVARLVRRGHTEADARARLAAQIDDEQRRPLCDVVLHNDGDEADLVAAVEQLWSERLVPFRENLTAGRPGPSGGVDRAAVERVRHRVARALTLPVDEVLVEPDGLRAPLADGAGVALLRAGLVRTGHAAFASADPAGGVPLTPVAGIGD